MTARKMMKSSIDLRELSADDLVAEINRRSKENFDSLYKIGKNISEIREGLFDLYTRASGFDSDKPIQYYHGIQSEQFMIDLLPTIQQKLDAQERGSVFDFLDVGPGCGMGSELLGRLYARSRMGYRLRVSTIDMRDDWKEFIEAFCPHVHKVHIGNIYEFSKRYDYVIASHVIEHVPNPLDFISRLKYLARKNVFLAAPFKENWATRSAGHINRIDEQFLEAIKAEDIKIFKSPGWTSEEGCKVFTCTLPGTSV